MTLIPFAPWLPDQPALSTEGSRIARNVRPKEKTYGPHPSLSSITDALDDECRGAVSVKDKDANAFNYAGDVSKLYRLVSASWTDASKVGGYTVAEDDRWEFTLWNQQIIPTQIGDPAQEMTLGGTQFADLITSTNKPQARRIGKVRSFLVLGSILDQLDGAVPNRVAWSGANDPTDFDPSPTTLSGQQDLDSDWGWVQAIVGGSIGTVFQEAAISRMTFVGSPLKFQFDVVEQKRGAFVPGGVVRLGTRTFYIAPDGFFYFNGAGSEPIGAGAINRHFFKDLNNDLKDKITSAIDIENSLVVWAYPSASSGSQIVDTLLIYNWVGNRWADTRVDTQQLLSSLSQGFTLEELDAFGDLDSLPASLDSRIWSGGVTEFSAFDNQNTLGTFTGAALAAKLGTETRALEGVARKALLQGVRPLIDGAANSDIKVSVNSANALDPQSTINSVSDIGLNAVGEARLRDRARYHEVVVDIEGGFDHAQGVETRSKQAGW